MYDHILQFFVRLSVAAALQTLFAFANDWEFHIWTTFTLLNLIVIYLLDAILTFLRITISN
jgi:hypothetical protein